VVRNNCRYVYNNVNLYFILTLAFIFVYYNDKVSATGILLVFPQFSERFQDPAMLSLAQIPLVLRGTENL
jgi:hypothetical protein